MARVYQPVRLLEKLCTSLVKFCKNPDFLERCIQVYQYLFRKERVVRNKVTHKLCRMVWVEVGLQRRIDWHSYGANSGVTLPPSGDIPRTCTYPNGGLGVLRTATTPPPTYDTEDLSEDSDPNGANPLSCQHLQMPFEIGKFELERGQEMAYHHLIQMPHHMCCSMETQVNPNSTLERSKHRQSDHSILPGILGSSLPQRANVHASKSPTILSNQIPFPDRIRFTTGSPRASDFYF